MLLRKRFCLLLSWLLVTVVVCGQATATQPLFSLLNHKETGLYFLNNIQEDDSLNVLRYEYLYNGAGIGIADFNKDGLNDVFFSGNTGENKLYLNKGSLKFEDITRKSGVTGNGTWATGVSIADVNGDGWLDIYVCHSGKFSNTSSLSNELFIHQGLKDGKPFFKEMAKNYGLDAPGTQSTQAAFFDYDLDGDLDMFLLNHSNHSFDPFLNTRKIRATPNMQFGNRLFRNDGLLNGQIHFTDVTLQSGIINNGVNFGLSVIIADVNKDGWPDIYTTSDYTERDCYYVNNRNGSFSEQLTKSFSHISKFSMGADIADYNNDGRPDVLTLDMLPEDNYRQKMLKGPDEYDKYHLLLDSGYYHQQMRNMLHLNEGVDEKGDLRFSEIGQLAGISNTDWSWSGLLADFDNDGWKDLFVSNGYLRDFTDMDFLKYTVADVKLQSVRNGNFNFQTYDLVKKMPSNKLNNYIFQNKHDLSFRNKSAEWGFDKPCISNAAAYADLDNDGDLDLMVCNNNEPAMLYENKLNLINSAHYLKIRLTGNGLNTMALGTKALLYTSDKLQQYQELYPVRGYQSSMPNELLFGYTDNVTVDSVKLIWPDAKETIVKNITSDTTVSIAYGSSVLSDTEKKYEPKTMFVSLPAAAGIQFTHKENEFIDFKDEVLLPYQLSRQGPAMAKADVNGDGLEDVFLGGAIGQVGVLYLQQSSGEFIAAPGEAWKKDAESEDVNAIFFDADNDGDADLYVVSGGNEYGDGSPEYADRLYLNDGKGNFSKTKDALPAMLSNKQAVAVGDFDKDGDLDLFVGGRGQSGAFPLPSHSYVLRNDTEDGKLKFTDITNEASPLLEQPGMITVASWVDLNKDGYPELMIGGDWMTMRLFKNNKGKLEEITQTAGLAGLDGMWAAMQPTDVDGDGDIDFILGNCGYNNQFKASLQEPMTVTANDFDNNGSLDAIVSYFIQGKSYPMASRDELLDQIVSLKKKYVHYKDYSNVTVTDIFSASKLKESYTLYCRELATGILLNNGNMQFNFSALPLEAQFSRVSAVLVNDFDKDGIDDLLIGGNFNAYRVQLGQSDASFGLFLQGLGGGRFKVLPPGETGCYLDGDVRSLEAVHTKDSHTLIIAGKNNAEVQVIKLN